MAKTIRSRKDRRAGWQYRNATGSHRRYKHPQRPGTASFPSTAATLLGIIKDAGLTVEEFLKLL